MLGDSRMEVGCGTSIYGFGLGFFFCIFQTPTPNERFAKTTIEGEAEKHFLAQTPEISRVDLSFSARFLFSHPNIEMSLLNNGGFECVFTLTKYW